MLQAEGLPTLGSKNSLGRARAHIPDDWETLEEERENLGRLQVGCAHVIECSLCAGRGYALGWGRRWRRI